MSMKLFQVGVKGVIQDERGVLLLKTNQERGSRWEFPGGRIDGNETLEDTIRRELAEELPGSELRTVMKTLGVHRLQRDILEDVSLILVFLLVEATLPDQIILSDEHVSHMWVSSLADVPEGLNTENERILRALLPG